MLPMLTRTFSQGFDVTATLAQLLHVALTVSALVCSPCVEQHSLPTRLDIRRNSTLGRSRHDVLASRTTRSTGETIFFDHNRMDKRVRYLIMFVCLQGSLAMKMLGWEDPFSTAICSIRAKD